MRTIQVKLESEIIDDDPKYIEYIKRRAAEKIAIDLYYDIVSRENHSVVLIRDREWLSGNPGRPELNYEIRYELTEARYSNFIGTFPPPKEVIKEVFVWRPPQIEYKHYPLCYCEFTWRKFFDGARRDIKNKIKRLVWKVKLYVNNYKRRNA